MKIKENMAIENFIEMEKLELKYYNEEHVTPHEEAYKWHLKFPETDVALEDKGNIVAFMDMLPIKDLIFEQIKEGHFNDKYLTTEHIVTSNVTEHGARFSEKLGFRRIGLSGHGTALYLISFADFAVRVEQL